MATSSRDAFASGQPPPARKDRTAWLLRKALELVHEPDDNGDFAEVLKLLNAVLPATVETAGRWLDEVDSDPMARWALVYVLGQLNHESTLAVLEREALRRLPKRQVEPGVCESAVDAQEMVSIMSISALGGLARAGVAQATDILFRVVQEQDRRSLRRPAVTELISVDPVLLDRVEKILPQEDRHLTSLRGALESDVVVDVGKRAENRPPPRPGEAKPKPRRTRAAQPVRPPKERIL